VNWKYKQERRKSKIILNGTLPSQGLFIYLFIHLHQLSTALLDIFVGKAPVIFSLELFRLK